MIPQAPPSLMNGSGSQCTLKSTGNSLGQGTHLSSSTMATIERQKSMTEVHISVEEVLKATRSDTLATRVRAADIDNDGSISVAEFLNMVSSELDAKSSAKRRLKVSIFLLVILILSLAANAGLTYAVVDANKETTVNNNGQLLTKDGSGIVATSDATSTKSSPRDILLSLSQENATDVRSMAVSTPDGKWMVFEVNRVEILAPGSIVAASSCDGQTVVADASKAGLMVFNSMAEAQASVQGASIYGTQAVMPPGEEEVRRRHLLGGGNGDMITVRCKPNQPC